MLTAIWAFIVAHGAAILAFTGALMVDVKLHFPALGDNSIYKAVNGVVEFLMGLFKPKS